MKKVQLLIGTLLLLLITLSSMQCKKSDTNKTELEKLPPITQTGANTFGCLVNGIAWLPNGRKPGNGGPNISLYVDPTFQGGKFAIAGDKYNDPGVNKVDFGAISCTSVGQFSFIQNNLSVNFAKLIYNYNCSIFSLDSSTYKVGFLNITRYDLQSRIFSGTFEATLYNATTCMDTIKITNGRFDVKL